MKKIIFIQSFFFFLAFLFLFSSPAQALETTIKFVTLSPSAPYIDTGIDIAAGNYIDVSQSGGAAIFVSGMTVPWVSLAGDPGCVSSFDWTLPAVNCWSLVGRIGTNNPFLVGSHVGFYSVQNGRLYLGINHKLPFGGSGSWNNIKIIINWVPPPVPPAPFLRLPWDYASNDKKYQDALLEINSFFDHEYPLLSVGLSLSEPPEATGSVVLYGGFPRRNRPYSSHDGYDWGKDAGASLNTPVLAASAGCAIFKDDCSACGNAILINHTNYYQTRYYHLQPTDLVTTSTTECTQVAQGQQIGKVGFSGNVAPKGKGGAHLHFMVIEDRDHDGDFADNIPDGLTDPFGWTGGMTADPWAIYTFLYGGVNKTGNDSHYLWQDSLPKLTQTLFTTGGSFVFQNLGLTFPANTTNEKTTLATTLLPVIQLSDILESVGTGFSVTMQNLFGTIINEFNQTFTLTIDFSEQDIDRFKPETLSVYSSSDSENWSPEVTSIDWDTKTATTQIDHLTDFALFGELKDPNPPQTTILFNGSENNPGTFVSPLEVTFTTVDAGETDYTLYHINTGDWQEYETPLLLTDPGTYTIEYYSVDAEENVETIQSVSFIIVNDTTAPEVKFFFDVEVQTINIVPIDESLVTQTITSLGEDRMQYVFTDAAGNYLILILHHTEDAVKKSFKVESLEYSDGSIITRNPNLFGIEYTENETGDISWFTQFWSFDDAQVRIAYDPRNDQSSISLFEQGLERSKEIRPGLVFLQVMTDAGEFEYSY